MDPLVSVLITAFNREKFIASAIDSVLKSSYENFEVIVVDDCSTDGTLGIALEFERKDSRVRVFSNKYNAGDYPNRNIAASYARGEFIMYTDSDDMLLPESIAKCVALLNKFPELNFALYYPEKGVKEPYAVHPSHAVRRQYFEGSFLQMGPGGIFLRKSFFEAIGGFPEKYGPASDMFFNIKAALNGDTVILPFPLVFYRRHENQEVNNQYSYIYNNYKCHRDLFRDYHFPFSEKEKRYIQKKNKRRFVLNSLGYFFRTQKTQETVDLFAKADFGIKDFIEGVFHF